MPIIEPCIRPPSEAESILLQVTTGCSCNSCSFCGAYKSKPFRIKSQKEIFEDIDSYAQYYPHASKLFLMDGDALILNNEKLLPVLAYSKDKLPHVNRISSYANGCNITMRSQKELEELRNHNLSLIYMGLESGSQDILTFCNKKTSVQHMVDAVQRASLAGIHTSLMVLLGLGGKDRSQAHVIESAKVINQMQPRYLSFLSLMIIPGTPLHKQVKTGEFKEQDAHGFLVETYEMLKLLNLKRTQFYANHASNYVPLSGRLPQSKETLLQILHAAIHGKIGLKPDVFRGL